jgi:hypothetical protein
MRTNQNDLYILINRLNELTDSPKTSWTRLGKGQSVANVGNFHMYSAYGAFALHRIDNSGGGAQELIGLCTKRELYEKIHSFINGINFKK